MRLTFLSHFLICLAVAAAAFFAWRAGALESVWRADASMMTSAIAALLAGSLAWLGVQAWRADGRAGADPSWGYLAERALPMLGLFGTAFGLSLQAKALAGGATSLGALATSLYCTASGVLAALVVAVATYNLEQGIRRAGRGG